jgi:mono/diheme cytochrome c family protein
MPSFAQLSTDDLHDVVDYVLVLTHRGELERALLDDAESAGEIDPEAVPEYVQNIVERWQEAERQQVMPLSAMPPFTPESIAAGKQAFLSMDCTKCHGKDGRGGTLGNVEVGTDVWGHKTAAADLTSGMFRGGGRPIDIYRRIYSGINGTPMPSFSNVLENEPEKLWQLVHFIKSVGNERRSSLPTLEAMWKRPARPLSPAEEAAPTNSVSDEAPDER